MWLLDNAPSKITINHHVKSINGGYQSNEVNICVDGENDTYMIGIPVPYFGYKESGGFKFNEKSTVPDNSVEINSENSKLYTRLKDLKSIENIIMMSVHELLSWYLDDFAFLVFTVNKNTPYSIAFTHKICNDSCLFVPTKLPIYINQRKPETVYNLTTENDFYIGELDKWVEFVSKDTNDVSTFRFKEWNWDEDTRIHTTNWESSDDDDIMSSDDDNDNN